jgi:hypothetical protein
LKEKDRSTPKESIKEKEEEHRQRLRKRGRIMAVIKTIKMM